MGEVIDAWKRGYARNEVPEESCMGVPRHVFPFEGPVG